MPIYVSDRLKTQVIDALRQARTPLTTNNVANLIGKSQQATRTALIAAGAERVDDSWPVLWTVADRNTIRHVPSQFSDIQLTVGAKDVDDILNMWNQNHEGLGDAIKSLFINEDTTPSFIAEQLGTIAGSIAYLAWQISEVADKPDWYEILTEKE